MLWKVRFDPAFELEFDRLSPNVQDEILAQAMVLEEFGPALGRPRVGSLRQSWHANMNELRFNADNGVWRVAFVFDTNRQAVLLAAGSKSGVSERLFYRELIGKADDRFHRRLVSIFDPERGRRSFELEFNALPASYTRRATIVQDGILIGRKSDGPKEFGPGLRPPTSTVSIRARSAGAPVMARQHEVEPPALG